MRELCSLQYFDIAVECTERCMPYHQDYCVHVHITLFGWCYYVESTTPTMIVSLSGEGAFGFPGRVEQHLLSARHDIVCILA